MAFSKTAIPVATPMPVACNDTETKVALEEASPRQRGDKKVQGQVAMNAIQSGYETASRLVLTLSPKPAEARELLHTLAEEIAGKIEAYSFRHE